ncbi:hypothetical protein M6B38_312315 [Iris pallida]|uniref:Uncharacterized protein n=1 Tax=Iris pallida TaxID=29817 RepID=A0AAX6HHC5_IRIPA|nr:hypothetical protein M6B38_312315 [Iris pallida]
MWTLISNMDNWLFDLPISWILLQLEFI